MTTKQVSYQHRKTMSTYRDAVKRIDSEAFIWIFGLIALAFVNPHGENHFTLCLFKNLGLDFCPGCGLGRSIAYLYRGEFVSSFQTHPLGAVAVVILIRRIVQLIRKSWALTDPRR